MDDIRNKFHQIGGTFLVSEKEIADELLNIKAFVFDWDGVFNNGAKSSLWGGGFSEADAMGVNMLRFNHWIVNGKIPFIFIITGENNYLAKEFAKREHFNAVYLQFVNKRKALQQIVEKYRFSFNEIAFVFDDILDLDASGMCKLSFCVRRNASPLFTDFIIKHEKCKYITGFEGGNHAVREISELIIGLTGQYNETINKRVEYGEDYKTYISLRNLINTIIETLE